MSFGKPEDQIFRPVSIVIQGNRPLLASHKLVFAAAVFKLPRVSLEGVFRTPFQSSYSSLPYSIGAALLQGALGRYSLVTLSRASSSVGTEVLRTEYPSALFRARGGSYYSE